MGIRTVILYWLGSRRAIEAIARSPGAVWVGLLFVLGAGVAREYDKEYLAAEPWHLLLPLVVSVGLAGVFFGLFRMGLRADGAWPGAGRAFGAFLRLFWMAAPLAFFYAIPWDRWLSAPGAVKANLWTLAVVVGWRVLLMVRIGQVVYGARWFGAMCVVMVLGDAIAFVVAARAWLPLIAFMGGVNLSDAEEVIVDTAAGVMAVGFCTMPVWLIGTGATLFPRRLQWTLELGGPAGRVTWPLKTAAVFGLLVWAFFLPGAQREQKLRWEAERLIYAGRVSEALAAMSSHAQADYPPHWDPPPRTMEQVEEPTVLEVMEAVVEQRSAEWVRRVYLEKFERQYLMGRGWMHMQSDALATWQQIEALVARLPEGTALMEKHKDEIEQTRRYVEAVADETTRPSTQVSGEHP